MDTLKSSLYFSKGNFSAQARKIKKNHPEKISYASGNENPEKIIYISGNGTFLYFRKLFIFPEVTFRARKVKRTHSEKLLIFLEMELSRSKLKKA